MKKTLFYILYFSTIFVFAQTNTIQQKKLEALPDSNYRVLRDSCTQLDIVFFGGGSMSIEGRNVNMFSSFVQTKTVPAKAPIPKAGFIMWQRNGREFLTGDIYLTSDTTGYLHFKTSEKEYFNQLTNQGASFLRRQKK
jgi:hypothetical protein